jgi:hypothetical protein
VRNHVQLRLLGFHAGLGNEQRIDHDVFLWLSAVHAQQLAGGFIVGFSGLQRICCSNWREAAIMPTMVSTEFTFEPSIEPDHARVASLGSASPGPRGKARHRRAERLFRRGVTSLTRTATAPARPVRARAVPSEPSEIVDSGGMSMGAPPSDSTAWPLG